MKYKLNKNRILVMIITWISSCSLIIHKGGFGAHPFGRLGFGESRTIIKLTIGHGDELFVANFNILCFIIFIIFLIWLIIDKKETNSNVQ